MQSWKKDLFNHPGKNIPAKIVYDPIAKYLIQKINQNPSFMDYESRYEKTLTMTTKVDLTNQNEIDKQLLQRKKKEEIQK